MAAEFEREVGASEQRKQRARRHGAALIRWFGTMGVVGWSIALPSLAGAALGMWLDQRYPRALGFTWTLTLLLAGLVIGCGLAWVWVRRELREP